MTKWFMVLFLLQFSSISFAVDNHNNQDSTLSLSEAKYLTHNIVVALERIYLNPQRAEYISKTLLSESFGENFKKEYDTDQFIREIRARIIQATLDTGIDLIEERSAITYSSGGELILEDQNGTVTTEISEDNVGYLKITGNSDFNEAKKLLRNSFASLESVDALIIDIRLADKVDLPFIRELLSYFVPEGTAIGTLTSNGHVEKMLTQRSDGYEKFKDNMPLYILTSSFVSGGWEFFSYSLQQLKKALIVGESTMGVAILNKAVKVGSHIVLDIPYARIALPETGDNWEEIGVIPDHEVSKQDALIKAYTLALASITK